MSDIINVTTIGGGGGHAQVLKALKRDPRLRLTAICPSTDSGGSTGILKNDYQGVGYLGDLTKCIAALCTDEYLAKALMHRFDGGCLHGHSVKNLLFLGLERSCGLESALEVMYRVCGLGKHRVIPVTEHSVDLRATLMIGNEVQGETQIDHIARNPLWNPNYHAIQKVYLSSPTPASHDAIEAIRSSAWCVICPGDLYSSILPVLLPDGMREAFGASGAKIAVILNIMTKRGETDHYRPMDFVVQIEKYLGKPCDVILCNDAPLPKDLILEYALEQKVQLDRSRDTSDPRMRFAPLAMVTDEGCLYHDPAIVAEELDRLFFPNP